MLHHRGRNHARPYCCEQERGLIRSDNLNSRSRVCRSLEKGRLNEITPAARSAVWLARDRSGTERRHTIQHVAYEEGLCGASVEGRNATIRCGSVSSAMNGDFAGTRIAVERFIKSIFDEAEPCSGSARSGPIPGAMIKTSGL